VHRGREAQGVAVPLPQQLGLHELRSGAIALLLFVASCGTPDASAFCGRYDSMVGATAEASAERRRIAAEAARDDRPPVGETASESLFRTAVRAQVEATRALVTVAPNEVRDSAEVLYRSTQAYGRAVARAEDLHRPSAAVLDQMLAAQSPAARGARAAIDRFAAKECSP
jgi:GTP cyclohydrolase III